MTDMQLNDGMGGIEWMPRTCSDILLKWFRGGYYRQVLSNHPRMVFPRALSEMT